MGDIEISPRLKEQLNSADPIVSEQARAELHRLHEEAAAKEQVDHPQHYGGADNPYEAIKVIENWGLGFCLGNTVKYISRAGKKVDRDEDAKKALLRDLKKAKWYLEREISTLESAIAHTHSISQESLQKLHSLGVMGT